MKQTALLSQALARTGSYFLLCNLLSLRVKQLEDGAQPKLDSVNVSNVEIALREIAEGKIEIKRTEEG